MGFWRNVSPSGAVKDFAQVWTDNPFRWRTLAVAIAATTGMLIVAIPKSERIEPEKPKVSFITTFAEGRSDAEIVASNIENQKRKEERQAEEEARAELRKDLYRQLGRATGLDVDEMERQIEEDRKAEEAAKEAAQAGPQAQVDGN